MRKFLAFSAALLLLGCGSLDFLSNEPPVYVVFFPDRETALTPDGKNIVDHVAAAARVNSAEMIQITGPRTDVAPGYDPSLAEPRIHTVEQALVDEGIDRSRFIRASLSTGDLNVNADPSGARRVEIRLMDKPAS